MTGQLPAELSWVGFDLDDTLHRFGRASGRASEAVFAEIERFSGVPTAELTSAYAEILRDAQGGHFLKPKTSREYRSERFAALLGRFGIASPASRLDPLLDAYDTALAGSLEMKPGARSALAGARRAGLSTLVVSEGPHDAQQATIERLGIASEVDLLVTSAGEGLAKTDGLLERALDRAGCRPRELLYVGDSIERDIEPALALGIACAYVGGGELPAGSAAIRFDLEALAGLLRRHRDHR
jgi:putative hydrolase of the HAD superfamily